MFDFEHIIKVSERVEVRKVAGTLKWECCVRDEIQSARGYWWSITYYESRPSAMRAARKIAAKFAQAAE